MTPPDSPDVPGAILAVLVNLAVFACAAVWVTMAIRWLRRLPVLPYQPRRPVPWKAFDVLLIASLYLVFMPALINLAAYKWFDMPHAALSQSAEAAPGNPDNPMKRAHPLARVLVEGRDIPTILMCVISAVIVAPITEEFLIRLVLQGWLESLERRIRRRVPWLRRIVAGFMPVMMVAVLFAAMHIRWNEPETDLSVVVFGLSVYTVSCVLLVAVSVCWLKFAAGATLADFGIVPSRLASDLRIAAWTLLAFAVPVYAINFDATLVLPKHTVVDPIPLFFLAIALGTLYYRTHRIIPSIALHMAFNAIGVFAAIAMSR